MAAKIIDGKCICNVKGLDFEVSIESIDRRKFTYIRVYNAEYDLTYTNHSVNGYDDEDDKLLELLKSAISLGNLRLTLNGWHDITLTEEYTCGDTVVVRSAYDLNPNSNYNLSQIIENREKQLASYPQLTDPFRHVSAKCVVDGAPIVVDVFRYVEKGPRTSISVYIHKPHAMILAFTKSITDDFVSVDIIKAVDEGNITLEFINTPVKYNKMRLIYATNPFTKSIVLTPSYNCSCNTSHVKMIDDLKLTTELEFLRSENARLRDDNAKLQG